MTTNGATHEPERPAALPAKAATADLGTLVDQLVKLGLEFAAEALPTICARSPLLRKLGQGYSIASHEDQATEVLPELPAFAGAVGCPRGAVEGA